MRASDFSQSKSIDLSKVVHKIPQADGTTFVVVSNGRSAPKYDPFNMYIIDDAGSIVRNLGSHASLAGAKKFAVNRGYMAETTTAGAVATVAKPLGKVKRRIKEDEGQFYGMLTRVSDHKSAYDAVIIPIDTNGNDEKAAKMQLQYKPAIDAAKALAPDDKDWRLSPVIGSKDDITAQAAKLARGYGRDGKVSYADGGITLEPPKATTDPLDGKSEEELRAILKRAEQDYKAGEVADSFAQGNREMRAAQAVIDAVKKKLGESLNEAVGVTHMFWQRERGPNDSSGYKLRYLENDPENNRVLTPGIDWWMSKEDYEAGQPGFNNRTKDKVEAKFPGAVIHDDRQSAQAAFGGE